MGVYVTKRELYLAIGALAFVVLCLSAMAGLHERHYRSRADRIRTARRGGIEDRIAMLEDILSEDRLV